MMKIKLSNKTTLEERLRTEVMIHAKDAHNIDRILSVKEHRSLLKLDEEALTIEGVKEFVEKEKLPLRKER